MDENQDEVIEETLDTQEEDASTEVVEEESIDDLKARLAKAEELAKNQKIRAEKAEAKKKEAPEPTNGMSTSDLYALMSAKVEQEDIADVEEYAKFKGISIADAIKSPVLKTLIASKAEERRMAQGTNTGSARRGSSQVSDEALLANARKGVMPESETDLARLISLQRKR